MAAWQIAALAGAVVFSVHSTAAIEYLHFSNQAEDQSAQAVLESEPKTSGQAEAFTICGSMYIRYFKGYECFFTIKQSGRDALFLSLYFLVQDPTLGYTVGLTFFGGSIPNQNPVSLRPHAWSHACTCLLYTSPSPRDLSTSRMPSSA